ncbi:MAG: hypothetical protein LC632_02180 [Xanthomonadaceae bacterium]|nr:hypothetical protein [Xanthomonadaceae bacterium]
MSALILYGPDDLLRVLGVLALMSPMVLLALASGGALLWPRHARAGLDLRPGALVLYLLATQLLLAIAALAWLDGWPYGKLITGVYYALAIVGGVRLIGLFR